MRKVPHAPFYSLMSLQVSRMECTCSSWVARRSIGRPLGSISSPSSSQPPSRQCSLLRPSLLTPHSHSTVTRGLQSFSSSVFVPSYFLIFNLCSVWVRYSPHIDHMLDEPRATRRVCVCCRSGRRPGGMWLFFSSSLSPSSASASSPMSVASSQPSPLQTV